MTTAIAHELDVVAAHSTIWRCMMPPFPAEGPAADLPHPTRARPQQLVEVGPWSRWLWFAGLTEAEVTSAMPLAPARWTRSRRPDHALFERYADYSRGRRDF